MSIRLTQRQSDRPQLGRLRVHCLRVPLLPSHLLPPIQSRPSLHTLLVLFSSLPTTSVSIPSDSLTSPALPLPTRHTHTQKHTPLQEFPFFALSASALALFSLPRRRVEHFDALILPSCAFRRSLVPLLHFTSVRTAPLHIPGTHPQGHSQHGRRTGPPPQPISSPG